MNKYLILEPFYSDFHIDVAHSLSNDIYSFVFNIGNYVYLKRAKKVLVHKKILVSEYSQSDNVIAKATKSLYTERLINLECREPSEDDFQYMAKYIAYLRSFIVDKKITFVLMHNDLRWQHALAIEVCKELGICYMVTERGLFRPNTITVDFKGVNALNCIPRKAGFYRNITVSDKTLKSYQPNLLSQICTNTKFFLFLLLNKVGQLSKLNTPLANKNYQLRNYLSLFVEQKFKSYLNRQRTLPKKYIFIPLQVNSDTQILVHSEYQNMQNFITQVEESFYALDSDLQLVFKVHPMEKKDRYHFDLRSIISENSTEELIKKSDLIVTINSTVGFEALQHHKRVMVIGEAFYKINELVICSSLQSFKDDLQYYLDNEFKIDTQLIDNFMAYLRCEYQVNGNLFNYDASTIQAVQSLIEQKQHH